MKFSIVHKISLMAVSLVLFSVSTVGWVFYEKTTEVLIAEALKDISTDIKATGERLQTQIDSQREDVVFLSKTPPINGMLRAIKNNNYDKQGKSTYQQWVVQLQSIFRTMLSSKEKYLALRFIDKNGRELVVVRNEEGKIVVSGKDELQDKFHRRYVRETLKLKNGETYLSEFNLNREYGKVTEPRQEVLRSAVPVFDETNSQIAGLVIITVKVGAELRGIQENLESEGRSIYITNDHGGYLLHPDAEKTYGFDLGVRFRIQEDIPQLAKIFLPDDKSTSLTLQPEDIGGEHVVSFTKLFFDSNHQERFLAVGMSELYSTIIRKQAGVLSKVINVTFFLTIITSILAVWFSYRIAEPIKDITAIMNDYVRYGYSQFSIPSKNSDEIAMLTNSYIDLINQVEDGRKGLEKMNRGLEERVIERTHELEVSERRQRSIINNMADALMTINEEGDLISFNPAAEKMFGYQSNEVIGCNIKMLMPEKYSMHHDMYLSRYRETGVGEVIVNGREVEGLRKDGSIFPLELSVSENKTGMQSIYTGVVRDITERKQVEKEKNEFVSTVSHELRTPLTSIRGALGLVTSGVLGDLPEKAKEMLTIAGNNTQRLLFLINDILDVQKIESGKMAFNFKKQELSKLIEDSVQNNITYAEQYGVNFVIENKLDNTYVFGDKERLMQVMANLLSNAAKFSPTGSDVKISVARHNSSIRISVTDAGEGVPEEFRGQLFDKFTQSDSSATREKGGTGLGLAISRKIIDHHKGIIDYVTDKSVGTTFYFELSELIQDHEAVRLERPEPVCEDRSPVVLIIDDNHAVAANLQQMLTVAGYDLDIVHNISEANKKMAAADLTYQMIVLDINLSAQMGVDFLEELKETTAIPVLVLSSDSNESEGGVVDLVDWIRHPVDDPRLLNVIKKVVNGNKKARVLHVEDDIDMQRIVAEVLKESCEITVADTLLTSSLLLDKEDFDVVLLDIELPDGSGLDLLDKINNKENPPEVVIFSVYDVENDYAERVNTVLTKSTTDNFTLIDVINNAVNHRS